MKKKYQDMLLQSCLLIAKILGVSTTGATATAGVYVSAYDDYHTACSYLGKVSAGIEQIGKLEKTIDKYRRKPGEWDIDGLMEMIAFYQEIVERGFRELENFVELRSRQSWE